MLSFLRNNLFIKIRNVAIIGILSFFIAYFFDQYYIYDKKWFFILDLLG